MRRQPLRSLLAVLGVAGGVSLTVGVLVTAASTTASIRDFGRQIAGPAPIRVMGPDTHGGVTPATLAAVQATPGVASALPVVQTVVQVTTAGGRSVDVAAIGTGSGGGSGSSGGADDTPPLISRRLVAELGPGATVWSDAGPIRLGATPGSTALDLVDSGRALVFPLAQAQRIFDRPGRFDAIYVSPVAGVSPSSLRVRLSAALGPSDAVQPSTDPPPDYTQFVSFLTPLLGLLSLATLAAAAALIFNIMALSLEERRRELAVASAIGARARFVVLGAVTEAMVIGGVGGVIGTGLGFLVARPMVGTVSSLSEKAAGVVSRVHATTLPIAAGVAIGLLVGAVSAWVPARRATRLDIVSELQQRGGASDAPPRVRVGWPSCGRRWPRWGWPPRSPPRWTVRFTRGSSSPGTSASSRSPSARSSESAPGRPSSSPRPKGRWRALSGRRGCGRFRWRWST
jgi:putative ABC transport system permease protein